MNYKIKIDVKFLYAICILLGIIALTFLIGFARDKFIIKKTRTSYNTLRSAYQKTVKTTKFEWTDEKMNTAVLASAFVKNLPIKKDCGFGPSNECFNNNINFKNPLEGTNVKAVNISNYYKVKLNNNVGVAFSVLSPTCSHTRGRCATVFVDINGPQKGPNKFGEDLYDFGIYKDDLKVYIIEANHIPRCLNGTGQGCAAYMFKYGNRNYEKYSAYVNKAQHKRVKENIKKRNKAQKENLKRVEAENKKYEAQQKQLRKEAERKTKQKLKEAEKRIEQQTKGQTK